MLVRERTNIWKKKILSFVKFKFYTDIKNTPKIKNISYREIIKFVIK